jgi:hypothetical protein
MSEIETHAVVALVKDLPEERLVRGQVGAVVADLAPGVYEVEFCDGKGITYAMVALRADQLMVLHFEPVHEAA